MIGILAYWEPQEKNFRSGRPVDLDVWRETVVPLGYDLFVLIDEDKLNPTMSSRQIRFETYESLEEALMAHIDLTHVYMMAERNIPQNVPYTLLEDYDHPSYALYIMGPDSGDLSKKVTPMDEVVAVKTQYNYALWSTVVAGIVMWDRRLKGYQ